MIEEVVQPVAFKDETMLCADSMVSLQRGSRAVVCESATQSMSADISMGTFWCNKCVHAQTKPNALIILF